jgi:protocatechuate 3,4-dioxygenase beta subunit
MTFFILVTLWLWAPPQTIPKNGTIEGTVTRYGTGDPIPDVEISMNGKGRSTNGITPQAITDAQGHFVIDDVPPGSYSIRAGRMGYANPAPGGVSVLEGGATRTVTVVAGERTENASLTMVRAGAIYGRILDTTGKPLTEQYVFVSSADDGGRTPARAKVDDRGDYHIVGIAPGKYNLAVSTNVTTSYFPGVTEKAKAAVLEIREGTVLTGIDMMVRNVESPAEADKTYNISGTVLDGAGTPMPGLFPIVDLLLPAPIGPGKQYLYKLSGGGSSGSFYFTGVRPGRYDVFLYFNNSTSIFGNGSPFGAIGRVEVSIGESDVKDVVLSPGGVSVSGQVTVTGNASIPSASVRLKMPSNSVQSRESKAGTAGEFVIPNVVSGVWKAVVSDLSPDLALLDVRQEGMSVYENGFSVEDRSPKPIQILLGPAGSISGIVRNEQSAPLGAAQIIVIPDLPDPSRPATLFSKATTDGTGRFTITNVGAGSYKVYALDPSSFPPESIPDTAGAMNRLLSPEIRSKGVAATVASGAKLELSLSSIH